MNRYLKGVLVLCGLSLCAAVALAAQEGRAGGERRAGRGVGRPRDRPGRPYLDPEHAPKRGGQGLGQAVQRQGPEGLEAVLGQGPNSWKVEDRILMIDFKEGEHGRTS